jgi:hypothetical protein
VCVVCCKLCDVAMLRCCDVAIDRSAQVSPRFVLSSFLLYGAGRPSPHRLLSKTPCKTCTGGLASNCVCGTAKRYWKAVRNQLRGPRISWYNSMLQTGARPLDQLPVLRPATTKPPAAIIFCRKCIEQGLLLLSCMSKQATVRSLGSQQICTFIMQTRTFR